LSPSSQLIHAAALSSVDALLFHMFTIVLVITSLCAFLLWLFRKYSNRRDHMGKKEDYEFFGSDRNSSWSDTAGDEHSFRRRM
jgi:hypothetical protein